ncbi:hypothetical protein ROR02_27930 [Pararhodospirillum oryzae]|uniref:Uncharacterized protein n=1 Tax=Pararhodospirillum oryzae TaxID=478448 RepID=A0A512HB42_9PROT|nr:hypothetical protein ROR02_27930 [Pararhodospirillum oryzae]
MRAWGRFKVKVRTPSWVSASKIGSHALIMGALVGALMGEASWSVGNGRKAARKAPQNLSRARGRAQWKARRKGGSWHRVGRKREKEPQIRPLGWRIQIPHS